MSTWPDADSGYKEKFSFGENKTRFRHQCVVCHYVKTPLSLHAIKQDSGIQKIIRKNNITIRIHKWTPDVTDIVSTGWFMHACPTNLYEESFTKEVRKMFSKNNHNFDFVLNKTNVTMPSQNNSPRLKKLRSNSKRDLHSSKRSWMLQTC